MKAVTDYTGCKYITAGHEYKVFEYKIDDNFDYEFSIKADDGQFILCSEIKCYHLGETGSWKLLEDVADNLEAKYESVCAELEELQDSLPKVKADAIREAARTVVRGMTNYDGVDVDVVQIDDILDYADELEQGE